MNTTHPDLSVVVPLYNEQAGIDIFHRSLTKELVALKLSYEIVYCDDGSHDNTLDLVRAIAAKDGHVNYLSFSRNFGKELATTAAIHAAKGKAVLIMDGDGQHPMQHIPEFVARWQQGKRVVVGVYTANKHRSSWFKSFAARTFYKLFNHFVGFHLTPGATDFRLIDRQVVDEFVRLKEHNRITRGLIDWLGYEQDYVYFEADPRIAATLATAMDN